MAMVKQNYRSEICYLSWLPSFMIWNKYILSAWRQNQAVKMISFPLQIWNPGMLKTLKIPYIYFRIV